MRKHAECRIGPWQVALLLAGTIVFIGGPIAWFATPWPTKAARYAWREWQVPGLAIALDRTDSQLAMEIGNAYFGAVIIGRAEPRHNPVLAVRAFHKALAIEPGILWGHYSLARIALIEGDLDAALAHINTELAVNPANLRSLYIRGLIYGYRNLPGDSYLAELDFTRFTKWAPSEWAGYNDLVWILAKEGKYAEVANVMTRAFTSVPGGKENPWFWNMLGVARLNLGDMNRAKVAFEKAFEYGSHLTLADWRRAYSGNSPANDQDGLDAFIVGIEKNLAVVDYAIAQ